MSSGAVRWAWLPLPCIAAAMLALQLLGSPVSYPAPALQFVLQLVFMLGASVLVALVAARSFLARGTPSLLLMGCGVIAIGLSGVLATGVGAGVPNRTVTTYNLLMCMGAWLHLAGVALGSAAPLHQRPYRLLVAYGATLVAGVLVAVLVAADVTPVFFVQGEGGTPLRQVVLGSTVAAFALAGALLLRRSRGGQAPAFLRWYGCGLLLVALGLLGVLLQKVTNSMAGWTAIVAQLLGSVYIALAALQAARDSDAWQLPLSMAPRAAPLRYGLAVLFVGAAVLLRMVFLSNLGNESPYSLLYPAVLLAALYGGWGPAVFAVGLSLAATQLLWVAPDNSLSMNQSAAWTIRGVFVLNSAIIAGVALLMQRARAGTQAAEHAHGLAEERAQTAQAVHEQDEQLRLALTAQKEVQARVWEAETRYRTLFDSIDHGVCVCELVMDGDGTPIDYRFLEVNPAFEPMTGLRDAVGKTALQLVPGLEQRWIGTYADVALKGQPVRFEERADALGRRFDVFAAPLPPRGCFVVVFSDITQRWLAEERLRLAAARDAFSVKLALALRPLADPVAAQSTACAVLGEWLAADRVVYFEVREGQYIVEQHHARGVPPVSGSYPIEAFGQRLQAEYEAGRTVVVDDVQADAAFSAGERAAFAAVDVAALVGVPLVKGGRLVGGLAVQSAQPRRFEANEVSLIEDTAEATWASVERARSEAALREANERKDEFIATLAHELRNPLAPVRNAVHILAMSPGDVAKQRWATDLIERQMQRMTRLIDDLLDASRINRGLVELRCEPVELVAVVQEAVEASEPLFEQLHHVLDVRLPAHPVWLVADRLRLAQVLSNLLHNAAKYTPRGGCIVLYAKEHPNTVELGVRDNGIGIPAAMLDRVFDLFAQSDRSTSHSDGGLGIGLTLVKRLVELHGGTVVARSNGHGKGSEFVVQLPLQAEAVAQLPPARSAVQAQAQAQAQATIRDAQPAADAAPPRRVLVVDDNRDAAQTLGEILGLVGHEVCTAHDGEEALREADRFQPDVVLLDIGLPKLSGYEVAQAIRARQWDRPVLLIALTGWGQDDDLRRTAAAGFDHHLVKPIEPQALLALLAQ
jgi:PAS domain S-box-containing protein